MAKLENVILENARIAFRNFAGKEDRYNREGNRNFSIFLEDDLARVMKEDGWNIKYLKPREGDVQGQPYIQVAVSYKVRPPNINMITSKGKTKLDENEVEDLDWVDIRSADVIIHPSHWSVNGDSGIKAYLQSLYVTIDEDPLDLKYAHLDDTRAPALPAGRDPNVIDGEVVYEYDGPRAIGR